MESKGKVKLKRKLKASNRKKVSNNNTTVPIDPVNQSNVSDPHIDGCTTPVSDHHPEHMHTVCNNGEPRSYPKVESLLQDCKHETSIDAKLNILCDLMQAQFQKIHQKVDALETKIGEIQMQSNAFGTCDFGSSTTKRAESKEAYLNENVKNVVNQPIYTYISQQCRKCITNNHVYDILHKVQDIYSVSASIIQDIQERNGVQLVYSFAFQKNAHTLYHWNNDHQSWEKMNQKHLQLLFDAIQKGIIGQYNDIILNQDENEDFEVENSIYIFQDDFDKKHRTFRKLIYEKILS